MWEETIRAVKTCYLKFDMTGQLKLKQLAGILGLKNLNLEPSASSSSWNCEKDATESNDSNVINEAGDIESSQDEKESNSGSDISRFALAAAIGINLRGSLSLPKSKIHRYEKDEINKLKTKRRSKNYLTNYDDNDSDSDGGLVRMSMTIKSGRCKKSGDVVTPLDSGHDRGERCAVVANRMIRSSLGIRSQISEGQIMLDDVTLSQTTLGTSSSIKEIKGDNSNDDCSSSNFSDDIKKDKRSGNKNISENAVIKENDSLPSSSIQVLQHTLGCNIQVIYDTKNDNPTIVNRGDCVSKSKSLREALGMNMNKN